MKRTVSMTIFLLLAGSYANAADQAVTGKRLLLKGTPKLVLLSKDPSISIAGSDPVGGSASSITIDDGTNSMTFSLPTSGWSTNGSMTLFKYKNVAAPGGPSAVKIAKLKPGLLKVIAKGLPFPVPNGAASIDVRFSLDGGTNRYCMTFTGTGDGVKFLVKDASAGSCSPPGPTATPTPIGTATPTSTPTQITGFCCDIPNFCVSESFDCAALGGTPVQGAVCDASGTCVPPPGAPGGCCVAGGGCIAPFNQASCQLSSGVFHASAVCLPSGACSGSPGSFCGNNVQEGIEECDGTDAALCQAGCAADCTCNVVGCGNNMQEGTETCDGTDDAACPNDCLPDCSCAAQCPLNGSADLCNAMVNATPCHACCLAIACNTACAMAAGGFCQNPALNNACIAALNAEGCAAECCP